jgi:hypothetical protein
MDNYRSQRERNLTSRRVDRACRYVTDLWLPVNGKLLQVVQQRLNDNQYEDSLDKLVLDVKNDLGLFTFCIRKVAELLGEQGIECNDASPLLLFEKAGLEQLKEILAIDSNSLGRHRLSEAEPLQIARFEEMMVAATASESLCEETQIDPDAGFTAAVFRQLGYALIAWNYPGLYEKAVNSLNSGESLEVAISRILGFSPMLLAARLGRSWGIPRTILQALEMPDPNEELEAEDAALADAISRTLATICRVGETLARANNPDIYPSARADWREAKDEITKRLGPQGIRAIQERFNEHCYWYVDVAPEIFRTGMALAPAERIFSTVYSQCTSNNQYLTNCSALMQEHLDCLYRALANSEGSTALMQMIAREVVPAAGFSGGRIFTADPALQLLVPQMALGSTTSKENHSVPFNQGGDIVAIAFKNSTPLVQENFGSSQNLSTSIAGVIGASQRVGVLYLEMDRAKYQKNSEANLVSFCAICQALHDCLRLK